MSLPPPKPEVEDDKISLLSIEPDTAPTAHDEVAKLAGSRTTEKGTDGQDYLNIPRSGPIRPLSPDTFSNLSLDEYELIRPGRRLSQHSLPGSRQTSRARHGTQTWRGRVEAFWLRNKGLALMLLAQVFGTLMNVTTRLLEIEGNAGKGFHPFQILFVRMSITLVLASLWMWYKKTPHFPLGMPEVRWLLIARGFGGFFGVFGMYYSLLYLPLADATVITFLAPSLACWACSILIKEPFTRIEQIAAMVSLFGVVLIARPTSLFSGSSTAPPASGGGDFAPVNKTTVSVPDASNYDNVTPSQRLMAVGIAMLGVLGAACAYTTIRWIGKRAHPLISVNYFAAWCTLVSIVMQLVLPGVGFLFPKDLRDWTLLIFLGLCGFIMQFLLAAGLSYEKSSRATNMLYTQMLFALAFDKLVFGTTPGILSILGSSLILGSAIYVAMQKAAAGSKPVAEGRDEERGLVNGVDAGDPEGQRRLSLEEVQLRTLR